MKQIIKLLKNPVFFSIIWFTISMTYHYWIEYLVLGLITDIISKLSLNTEAMIKLILRVDKVELWIAPLIILFFITYCYTRFFYKQTMNVFFKGISIALFYGLSFALILRGDWSWFLYKKYTLIIAIPLYYLSITIGNFVAMKMAHKKTDKN